MISGRKHSYIGKTCSLRRTCCVEPDRCFNIYCLLFPAVCSVISGTCHCELQARERIRRIRPVGGRGVCGESQSNARVQHFLIRIALLHPFCPQVGEITLALGVGEDRLGDKGDPVFRSFPDAFPGRVGNVLYPYIRNVRTRPRIFLACTVDHPSDRPRAHGVHGQLAVVFLAECNSSFNKMITAHGYSILIFGAVIRAVHPRSPSGNASVSDEFQSCGKDLPVPVRSLRRDPERLIICEEIPHIINADSLVEAPFRGRLIDRNIIAFIKVTHIADRSNTLRGEDLTQFHQVVHMLFNRLLRHQRHDQIAGVFLEHSRGFTVFITLDLPARRIWCIPVNASQFESHTVYAADMCACAHNGYGRITAAPVQIIAGGRAFLEKSLFIIAPSLDPFSGFLLFSALTDRFDKIFYRIDLGRHCCDLPAEIRQHDRMHMSVHKSGDHASAFQVSHRRTAVLCVRLPCNDFCIFLWHVGSCSDPDNAPRFDDHAVRIGQPVI